MNNLKDINYYLILIASTAIVIGVEWDISWHSSIGRDKLLSPPHVLIYIGDSIKFYRFYKYN